MSEKDSELTETKDRVKAVYQKWHELNELSKQLNNEVEKLKEELGEKCGAVNKQIWELETKNSWLSRLSEEKPDNLRYMKIRITGQTEGCIESEPSRLIFDSSNIIWDIVEIIRIEIEKLLEDRGRSRFAVEIIRECEPFK